jgi:hypothetical protein
MSRAAVAWLAIVVPIWVLCVLCTYWEPVIRDGWNHYFWHIEHELTAKSLWDYSKATYLYNNPRLGQVVTLLQHTPGPWHVIFTPLMELGMFIMLAALMLGRWPSLRRADDALLTATIIAMVFVTGRSLGPMLFYRPFSGNYTFGFVLNLLWLVPFRIHAEQAQRRGWWLSPAMFVLGVASGLCNEHTGPAFLFAGVVALVIYWRRGERFVPWAWAGVIGMLVGSLLLFYAPGQELRYEGLAAKQSTLDLIVERGFDGNAKIIFALPLFLTPLILWFIPGGIMRMRHGESTRARTQINAELMACVMSGVILLTLLASPKWGERLYFAPTCLMCAAAASWFCARLGKVARYYAIALAAVAIAFVSYRLLVAYHTIHREYVARMNVITHAAPGTTVRLPPYTQGRSRYVLGDDLLIDGGPRQNLVFGYKLTAIEIEGQREPTTPPPADP